MPLRRRGAVGPWRGRGAEPFVFLFTSHGPRARPMLRAVVMPHSAIRPLVAVLNGPNMNMLGLRQPDVHGRATLDDVEALCAEAAEAAGLAIDFRQTNGEGELVTWVQECRGRAA